MKTTLLKFAVTALLASSTAFAIPDSDWDLSNLFNVNSLGAPDAIVDGNINGDYKFDVDTTTESGMASLVSSLTTVISDDGLTAMTTWSPPGSIDINTVFLKAGNQYAAWDTSGVNWSTYSGLYVTQNAIMNNPENAFLGISHETLNGGSTSVPDGGTTAVLLGAGLVVLGLLGRRHSARPNPLALG
jgi:hypothetical protein